MCWYPLRFAIWLLSATSSVVTLKNVSKFNPAFLARWVTTILSLPVEFVLIILRSVCKPYCCNKFILSCSIWQSLFRFLWIVSCHVSKSSKFLFCLCLVKVRCKLSSTDTRYNKTTCPPVWRLLQCCYQAKKCFHGTNLHHNYGFSKIVYIPGK